MSSGYTLLCSKALAMERRASQGRCALLQVLCSCAAAQSMTPGLLQRGLKAAKQAANIEVTDHERWSLSEVPLYLCSAMHVVRERNAYPLVSTGQYSKTNAERPYSHAYQHTLNRPPTAVPYPCSLNPEPILLALTAPLPPAVSKARSVLPQADVLLDLVDARL